MLMSNVRQRYPLISASCICCVMDNHVEGSMDMGHGGMRCRDACDGCKMCRYSFTLCIEERGQVRKPGVLGKWLEVPSAVDP